MMKGMRGAALLLGGVAAIAVAAPALAQSSTESAQGSDGSFASTDIVVTAQRRSELAQDVPIVISAFSDERLQQMNISKPQDLYGSVPSLVSGTQGQATRDVQSYSIRGQSTGFLASPGVQIYLNEVPVPSSISLNLQGAPGLFADPENVQVLSGPQGTLFGRNTTGGAVLFTPKKPSDNFEGYIQGSLGNLKLRSVEGAVNVPVIPEKLLVRVSGVYQDRRGFTKDLVWNKWRDDIHYYAGRVGVVIKPTERVENYLLVYGSKSSNNGAGFIHNGFNIPGLAARGYCSDAPGAGISSCDIYRKQTEIAGQIGPRKTRGDLDGFSKIDSWGVINNTSVELSDELTLRNIVSYQKLKDNYGVDQDGTPIQQYELSQGGRVPTGPIPGLAEYGLPATPGNAYLNGTAGFSMPRDNIKQFTEELQLQGNMLDNHLNFAVGAFYYNATPASDWGSRSVQFCGVAITGLQACGGTLGLAGVSNKSKALYGQATLDLGAASPSLEGLRVTAGYRYTWDRIVGFASSWAPLGAIGNFCVFGTPAGTISPANVDPAVGCNFGATLKSKAPTWTFGVDYKVSKDILLYAKVSRGYKSGGFNTFSVRPNTQTFAPERLTTYEGGFKSDWNFGSVPFRFNATYYYSDYKGIQRPGGDFNIANNAGGAAIFSAEATIQGVEIEASLRPTDTLEIGGTFSHADGDYKKYEITSTGGASCNNAPFLGTADFSCAPFQFLTPFIYSVYGNFKLPVPDSYGKPSLYVSYSFVDDQYSAPGPFEPGGLIKGYGLLNASLNWNDVAGSGFDVSVFGNNLTNKLYRVSNSNSFAGNLVNSTLYGEPRTYGVKLRYSFGGR